jgi:hypothetical protein
VRRGAQISFAPAQWKKTAGFSGIPAGGAGRAPSTTCGAVAVALGAAAGGAFDAAAALDFGGTATVVLRVPADLTPGVALALALGALVAGAALGDATVVGTGVEDTGSGFVTLAEEAGGVPDPRLAWSPGVFGGGAAATRASGALGDAMAGEAAGGSFAGFA